MSRFGPGGKAHIVLQTLAVADASYDQLAVPLEALGMKRKNVWYLLGKMLEVEIIGGSRRGYYILPAGRQALQALESGREASIDQAKPTIRRFAPDLRRGA